MVLLPGSSFAQSALTDDAHTSTAPKSTAANFGTNPNLNVSASGNVYLKFKLSSTLPANTPGSEVERATLKLYIGNIMTAGRLDVYAVGGAWDESLITGNNAPPLGGLVTTTAQIGEDRRHKFLVIDVTSLVQQWLGDDGQGTNGLPNNGLALVAHPTDATTPEVVSITFDSKENSQTSHEAQLNIQLERAADGLQKVEHDASLTGDGTSALPLGVANGGINSVHLANDAVTNEKLADNAVTSTELADGSVTSPKITAPLSLTSADAGFTLSAANTGAGAAITATGAINTTTQYNIGGSRVLSTPGNANLVAGLDAGASLTSPGLENSFFGRNSGKFSTTAQFNSFFGNSSGRNNTTGSRNVFAGWGAGLQNTTGGPNSFVGVFAGRSNTTGEHNTHFGNHAGSGYQAGSWNTFIGSESGTPISELRDGNNNTALGYRAWVDDGLSFAAAIGSQAVVSANDTIVIGKKAGTYNGVARPADRVEVPGDLNIAGSFGANILSAATQFNLGDSRILSNAGTDNLFVGIGAGAVNTTGSGNSFFGRGAGFRNTTSSRNSFFGAVAGVNNTTGFSNSFFGTAAGADNTTGAGNSFFGDAAGIRNTTGGGNSFFGNSAGFHHTTGFQNTILGAAAGLNITTGSQNTFVGSFAGPGEITGNQNTFVGNETGGGNTIGSANTLLGFQANVGLNNLSNATAIGAGAIVSSSNTVVLGRSFDTVQVPGTLNVSGTFGASVLNAATQLNIGGNRVLSISGNQELPNSNLFVGIGAGAVNTGIGNSFFGRNAGLNNTLGGSNSFFGIDAGRNNTLGTGNAFFGDTAGTGNLTGGANSFFGVFAGGSTTSGSRNTFIGRDTGNGNVTGSNNTILGANANVGATNLSFATALGAGAVVSASNSLVLGGIAGVNGGTDTNIGIGTTAPQARLDVRNGNILVGSPGQGIILKSPDGATCRLLSIDNMGALALAPIACP